MGSISLRTMGTSASYGTAQVPAVAPGYAQPAVASTVAGAVPVEVGAFVTTRIPYKPIGPWMDGCVPDSIRYVPGRRLVQAGNRVVAPAATSVENDCTRFPCTGGVPQGADSAPHPTLAMGHVTDRKSVV